MDNRQVLVRSQAGLRLIGLMTLFNRGELDRLRDFIAEYYTDAALENQSAEARAGAFEAMHARSGRQRVHQIMGISDHHAVVTMQAEVDQSYYIHQVKVEEDYPHRVIEYSHRPLDGS